MSSIVSQIFKVGIGPSSSHTVGPMLAANLFLKKHWLNSDISNQQQVAKVTIDLYGSLALTGKGHATDIAILLGLQGETPAQVDIKQIDSYIKAIKQEKTINLLGQLSIPFNIEEDLQFHFKKSLKEHANGMIFTLWDNKNTLLTSQTYFSIGGGVIQTLDELNSNNSGNTLNNQDELFFSDAKTMLGLCEKHKCSISELMWMIEKKKNQYNETKNYLLTIWQTMQECVENGLHAKQPLLPGGLNLERRAPLIYKQLLQSNQLIHDGEFDPASMIDWVSLYAIAVNEENASCKRVVTAPTNGSAGVIPAVMHYLKKYHHKSFTDEKALDFLINASAIGHLYQKGASISAAEMGCQGEIGVSCSMSSSALCEFLGGTPIQSANAAEIGMEHHLGMTCDPIDGLVQIPCIERNTMGAIKGINAARLSIRRDSQRVSLDEVIQTMFQTGKDMKKKYKETAKGGLAKHVGKDSKIKEYQIAKNQVAC